MSLHENHPLFLIAALALREGLLDAEQFAAAGREWAGSPDANPADLLVRRGWISADDRVRLERLLESHTPSVHCAPTTDEYPRRAEFTTPHTPSEYSDSTPTVAALGDLPGIPQHVSGDRYRRVRVHAAGGIGRVWLAQDENLARVVALKELHPHRVGHPVVTARFLREARITGQLEHPGVVPVYDLVRGEDGVGCYYTMRLIRGRTLTDAAADYHRKREEGREGPLDLRELLQAFLAVCNVVAYAHSRHVIHRDLKGANVVLGDFGEVIVLDWGLAREADTGGEDETLPDPDGDRWTEGETAEGQVLGTPAFMSPEQAEGRQSEVTELSDVYGLGAMLYQILTGQPPFRGTSTADVLRQVRESVPPTPRSVNPAVPPALQAVCLRAMARLKEDRYPGASELGQDVRRWLADEPVSAFREPASVRLGRWSRRNRPLVAAAAALLVTSVVGLGLATVLVSREKARTELARAAAQDNYEEAEEQRGLAVANAQTANEQRRRAEANFQKAREAVDEMLSQVGDERLRNVPQMERLRKKLLQEALAFYQDFLKQKSDDPAVKFEAARAQVRLANIRRLLGQDDESIADLEAAQARFKELAEADRADPAYRDEQASAHHNLGNVLQLVGQHKEAEAQHTRAIDLLKDVVKQHPSVNLFWVHLSNAYSGRGSTFQVREKIPEALADYREAEAIRRKLYEGEKANPIYRRLLGQTHYNYGNLYYGLRKYDEAERSFTQSIALWLGLLEKNPDERTFQEDGANVTINLGNVLQMTDRLAEAEKLFLTALRLLEPLTKDFPGYPHYREQLGMCLYNLGNLNYVRTRFPDAETYYKRALPLLETLVKDHPRGRGPLYRDALIGTRMNYANVLHHTDRYEEAEKLLSGVMKYLDENERQWGGTEDWQRRRAGVHFNFGNLYVATNRAEEARKQYERALAIQQKLETKDPANRICREDIASTHLHLGNLHQDAGRFASAARSFKECLRRQEKLVEEFPRAEAIRRQLGAVYYNLGNLQYVQSERGAEKLAAAESWYSKALKVQESLLEKNEGNADSTLDVAQTQLNLGNVYQYTGREKHAEKAFDVALRLGEQVRKQRPKDRLTLRQVGACYYNRGNLFSQLGRYRESKESYLLAEQTHRTLIDLGGEWKRDQVRHDLAEVYNNLAMQLSDCPDTKFRDVKAGREYAEKAVKLAPDSGSIWNTVGISRFRVEDWKGAKAALERSMTLRQGGDGHDWFFVAMAEWKLGEKEKAAKWFAKARAGRKQVSEDATLKRYEEESRKVLGIPPEQ